MMLKVATFNLISSSGSGGVAELPEDIAELVLQPVKGEFGQVGVVVKALRTIKKVLKKVLIWPEAKSSPLFCE